MDSTRDQLRGQLRLQAVGRYLHWCRLLFQDRKQSRRMPDPAGRNLSLFPSKYRIWKPVITVSCVVVILYSRQSKILPSYENRYVKMVWMSVVLRVHLLSPLGKTRQRCFRFGTNHQIYLRENHLSIKYLEYWILSRIWSFYVNGIKKTTFCDVSFFNYLNNYPITFIFFYIWIHNAMYSEIGFFCFLYIYIKYNIWDCICIPILAYIYDNWTNNHKFCINSFLLPFILRLTNHRNVPDFQ